VIVYGDVYEMAKVGAPIIQPSIADGLPTPNSAVPVKDMLLPHVFAAPQGYEYRQLNTPGSEVTCDIMDVAGRVYPDLLEGSSWFRAVGASGPETKQAPGDVALSLLGLRPASLGSESTKWRGAYCSEPH
jgi:hypothetical protein